MKLQELEKRIARTVDTNGNDSNEHFVLLDRWYRLETERIAKTHKIKDPNNI